MEVCNYVVGDVGGFEVVVCVYSLMCELVFGVFGGEGFVVGSFFDFSDEFFVEVFVG